MSNDRRLLLFGHTFGIVVCFYFLFGHSFPIVVCFLSSFSILLFLPQISDCRLLLFFFFATVLRSSSAFLFPLFFLLCSTNDIAYERFTRSLVVRETQKILAAWSVRAPCGSLSRVVIGFRCCLLDVISDVNILKGRPDDVLR